MTSKESILAALRANTLDEFPMPDLSALEAEAVRYDNPVQKFCEVTAQVGGRAVELSEGESIGRVVSQLYPTAKRVAWALPDVQPEGCPAEAVFNPDAAEQPADLNGTDVAVIPAQWGVCENACCWIEQHVRNRALYFIAEALVIVLRKDHLLNNMHEAYARMADAPDVPFAAFISGPSKTADIEQALVMGAHGAREVTVVLV